eukprot:365321-Chlamydomonas_euryale.AAC.13
MCMWPPSRAGSVAATALAQSDCVLLPTVEVNFHGLERAGDAMHAAVRRGNPCVGVKACAHSCRARSCSVAAARSGVARATLTQSLPSADENLHPSTDRLAPIKAAHLAQARPDAYLVVGQRPAHGGRPCRCWPWPWPWP